MSAVIAIGPGYVSVPDVLGAFKRSISRTGGKLPELKEATGSYWPASYFVQAAAIADKFII